MIELGVKARDKASQFTGTVTGICHYLAGTTSVCLEKEGVNGERLSEWFNIERLEVAPG